MGRILVSFRVPNAVFCVVATLCILASETRANILTQLEESVVSLYREKSDAVVRVKVATTNTDENGKAAKSLTVISGFFISEDGKVLTNALPSENVARLWIVKDGISYIAETIGTDVHSNISLIKAINLPESFTSISLSEPKNKSRIGSFAFAVTSPLDFAPSPSLGLVTGFESQFGELTFPFTYTRINIPIGPAEGGSPVFNSSGELLGISVATLPDVDSGYIVPTISLQRIVEDIESKGHAVYGSIPITIEERANITNTNRLVYVKAIERGSQAAKAGIRVGDAIIASAETPITGVNQLRDLIFFTQPGSFLSMTILRGNEEIEFALLIESPNVEPGPLVTSGSRIDPLAN